MNRYRAFMITATVDYANLDELEKTAKSIPKLEYAIILHDKDAGTVHYHTAIYFKNATTISTVAKKFKVKQNFIKKWDSRTENLWAYLVHHTDEANSTKADYIDYLNNPDKLRTNIADFGERTRRGGSTRPLDEVIDKILEGVITRKKLLAPNMIKFYYKNIHKIDNAIKLRTESLKYSPPICTTIYIYGKSNAGKSTEAKRISESLYLDNIAHASSPNDLLQDYTGEKCLVIDDFRPGNFEFTELLGMLDPIFRQRTFKSRYYNKPLATELIILTSTYPLDEVEHFYLSTIGKEDMVQLRRRLPTVKHATHEGDHYDITTTVYDEQNDVYIPFIRKE